MTLAIDGRADVQKGRDVLRGGGPVACVMPVVTEFVTLLLADFVPLAARAQHQPTMPLVGVLGGGSTQFRDALAQGLKETGYIEGHNVRIEYRWAEGAYDRLPAMADDLVNLHVNVLAVFGGAAMRPAKAAASKVSPPIPVIFAFGGDPVAEGWVASFARPGGNMTGAISIGGSLAPKRLEFLRGLGPVFS